LKCPICGAASKDVKDNGGGSYFCKLCFSDFQWPAKESVASVTPPATGAADPLAGMGDLLAMYGVTGKKPDKAVSMEKMSVEELRKIAYEYEYGEKRREKDLAKAFAYFKVAAEKGDSESMYKVAYAYENGQGTEINKTKAYFWYKEGLRAGNSRCGIVIRERFAKFVAQERAAKEQNAPRPNTTPVSNEGVNVYEKSIAGVLEVTCRYANCISSGSGFLISNTGYAITNTHVVTHNSQPCRDVSVRVAGETIKASVVMLGDDKGGRGNGVDLALLKLSKFPARGKSLCFENFDNVRIGEQVYVIGNSLGDGTCITSGIVSDKCRTLNGHKLLMTDCPINNGNSGGPIFNAKGKVIGVIVSSRVKADGSATEGMNYAIPSFIVEEFLNGEHTAVRLMSGEFSLPPTKYCICPECGGTAVVYPTGSCICQQCHKRFTRTSQTGEIKKAKAPCPICNSWNTNIQNNIFHCDNCGFTEGDKIRK